MVDQEMLQDLTESYLKSLILEASDTPNTDFDARAPFGELGINSYQVLKIIKMLEADFGTLPKSLLFENYNVNDLAGYFVEKHRETLFAKFAADGGETKFIEAPEVTAARSGSAGTAVDEAVPILMLEKDAYSSPEYKELIQALYERHKTEGNVSRGTRKIAPNLFIGSSRLGYFNYGRSKDIILVYGYTGPGEYAPVLLEEMLRYCASHNFQLNVMSAEELPKIGGTSFSATPFGVLQRIVNLKQFTLEGGAMRHLRQQVSKFKRAGTCRTEEYRCGSRPETDQDIARIIDRWCETKTMVNPLIYDFRSEVLAGSLTADHRLFLTYLDDVLQNVILITAMSAVENGYLMDLEFYPSEMPTGGLEFAIVQIIDVLVREGCDMLSLGGTYGCKLESSPSADPGVEKVLDDLREHKIFNDEGNLQFKNKFRPENKSVFLCRPVSGCDPGNVTDIIMMIADPVANQTPDHENHNSPTAAGDISEPPAKHQLPVKASGAASASVQAIAIEGNERSRRLADFGFNPLNIPDEHVDLDLKTDSWAQLHLAFIDAQMRRLRAQLSQPVNLDEAMRAAFPFAYFVLTGSGTAAENIFSLAWRKKGAVLQNLLFPSTIFHFMDKGFTNREMPHSAIFDLYSRERYKGDVDMERLRAEVARNASAIAFVCIDVGNNASGGQPVSLAGLRSLRALLSEHSIPLVIDGTRVMENARFLIEHEKECAGKNMWAVAREIFSYADVAIGSLTKDFCVSRGGVIATNNAALFERLQAFAQAEGAAIDPIDRKIIALSFQEKARIEAKITARMEAVQWVWQALNERNIPVVSPAGGHCILIDVKQIPEFQGFQYPVASFLAWLYLNTGIRAGAHSVGMQQKTSINGLVRLAIPVGLMREKIEVAIERLACAFANKTNIPEIILNGGTAQPFLDLHANYKLIQCHNPSGSVVAVAQLPAAQLGTDNRTAGHASISSSASAKDVSRKTTVAPEAAPDARANANAKSASQNPTQDIAIIGMAGRYPQAKNLREMWKNLALGKDCIEEIPADRYQWRERYGDAEKYRGGFLDGVDKFDSLFFNISPREAKMLDPQERLFLEVAWETLEDAGYYPENLSSEDGSRKIGVFVGAVWAMYQMLSVEEKSAGVKITPNSFLWSIANRVSYWMNLSGPSMTVDTACSSSLTALHLACEAIRAGDCTSAIVGGVNLDLHQAKTNINAAGGALSPDGVCRAFGKGANGYVAGEGVGALLLKPLEQALRDKDNIYAVIKSAVVSHGGRTSGYTVPNPKAQASLIASALEKAGIDARTIGYIEAHGTGTALGDPIEITGLSDAFKSYEVRNQTCAIGSIKSNIGHLEAAAGVVGVSKVLLQMRHRRLAPSLHSSELNEFIDLKNSPFYVVQALEDWKEKEVDGVRFPLRAGVSSFGAGGSNAHVILEAYEPTEHAETEAAPAAHIFPLSARDEIQLRETAIRLAALLQESQVELADVAYTLRAGRKSFDCRASIVAKTKTDLLEKLSHFIEGTKAEGVSSGHVKNAEGLTRRLDRREKHELIRLLSQSRSPEKLAELWVEGLLADWQGTEIGATGRRISLPTYPFAGERHWACEKSPIARSSQTVAGLHPLVDSNESTFERQVFKKVFHDQDFFIYDHYVAGIPTLPGVAYLELARKAGEIAGGRRVQKIKNIIWISPITLQNSAPKEVFIELKAGEAGVRFEVFSHEVNGGHTLHSQGTLQYSSRQETEAEPEYIDLKAIRDRCERVAEGKDVYPRFQSFGLTLGASFQVLQEIYKNDRETLGVLELPECRQGDMDSMVLHPSLVDGSLQAGVAAQLGKNVEEIFVPFSIGEVEVLHPLQTKCYSYITQAQEDKRGKNENARVVKSDVFVVDETGKILVKIRESTGVPLREVHKKSSQESDSEGFSRLFYSTAWEKAEKLAATSPLSTLESTVIFDASRTLFDLYQERLRGEGAFSDRVVLAMPGDGFGELEGQRYSINPGNPEDFTRFLETLLSQHAIENICFAWPLDADFHGEQDMKTDLDRGIYPFLSLCQALVKLKLESKVQLLYLYSTAEGEVRAGHEAIAGFIKTLRLEHPKLLCKALEVRCAPGDDASVLNAMWQELRARTQDAAVVRCDGQDRYVCQLKSLNLQRAGQGAGESAHAAGAAIREGGVYLITGGAGGLGVLFAEFLAKRYKGKVVLTGRSGLNAERNAKLEELRASGAELLYLPADISKLEDARNLISRIKSDYGELHGIIHAAGVLRDSSINNKTREEMSAVFAPKIYGTLYLDEVTKDEKLDFFVLFSSLAGVNGNIGQCDYAFANRFMGAYAAQRELLRASGLRSGKTVSINWSLWADGGMKVDKQAEAYFRKTLGIKPISASVGVEAFLQAIALGQSQVAFLEGVQDKVEVMWGLRRRNLAASSASSGESAPTLAARLSDSGAAIGGSSASISASSERAAGILSTRVQQVIARKLAEALEMEAAGISNDVPFADYGVNSTMGVHLVGVVSEALGIEIDPLKLFEYTTVNELAQYICEAWPEKMGGQATPAQDPAPVEQAPQEMRFVRKQLPAEMDRDRGVGKETAARDARPGPIAIIGMSGRFAESESLDELWVQLKEGKNLIRKVSRWNPEDCTASDSAGSGYCSDGSFIDSIDRFDPAFFGISPQEAVWMEPQQRLFLEESWRALEDAGYVGKSANEKQCGVYVGCASSNYDRLFVEDPPPYAFWGNAVSVIPARIAYHLNLQGPAIAVDTASSSSLVAIHLACQSLWSGETEMALAGGVFLQPTPGFYRVTNGAGLLSPDGICYSFDARANGFVPGEGVGVMALKRLEDAVRDRDHVHALIVGSGVNQDGSSNGIIAPNARAQERLERSVYDRFRIDPESIQMVEANGTGTLLGDSIEFQALTRAFRHYTQNRQFCAIGSIATNLGHAATAAGVAGILKLALSIKHGQIPPTLHYQSSNPAMDLESSPFYVNTELRDWPSDGDLVRRAAVSSFGIGGTNAHVVLEEAPSFDREALELPGYVIPLSARTTEQLKRQARNLLAHVRQAPRINMNDLSYSLFVSRMHFPHRLCCVAVSRHMLVRILEQWLETGAADQVFVSEMRKSNAPGSTALAKFGNHCIQECRKGAASSVYLDHLATIADLFVQGHSLDFGALFPEDSRRVSLPTYPFADERYWVDGRRAEQTICGEQDDKSDMMSEQGETAELSA
jgi:acyl transferase domain-containing protein/tryptophanase/acyl carrier protein